jgi:PAS domain S-box-containing protein
MKARRKTSGTARQLGLRPEQRLAKTRREVAEMPVGDVQKLVHQLQVHQIELEMQNEELRRSQMELETARDRYADLYDFAPVAHLTLSKQGEILEANLTAGKFLRLERGRLIHQKFTRFIHAAAQDTFYQLSQHVFSSNTRQSAELALVNLVGQQLYVRLDAGRCPAFPAEQFRVSLTDITESKQAEAEANESRSLSQAVMNSLTAHIAVLDRQGNIVAVNEPWNRFAQENGSPLFEKTDERVNYLEICRRAVAAGEPGAADILAGIQAVLKRSRTFYSAEYPCHSPDQECWFMLTVTPLASDDGVVVSHTDITRRKLIEVALQEKQRLLQTVLDLVPHFIFVKDIQSRHLLVNRACAAANGLTPEQMVGRCDLDFVPDRAQAEAFMQADREIIASGKPKIIAEERLTNAAGQTQILRTTKIPFVMPDAGGPAVMGVAVDVTDLKQAEVALRKSEERFRSLFESMQESFFLAELVYDSAGKPVDRRILDVNPAFSKSMGLKREAVLGRTSRELFPGLEDLWFETAVRVALTGEPAQVEGFNQDKGRYYDCRYYSPRQGQFACVFTDITERKRAENALRASERNLRTLTRALEQSPSSVLITSTTGEIEYVNPKFIEITGYSLSEVLGKNPRLLKSGHQSPEFYKRMWTTITSGKDWRGELCNRRKNGALFWEFAVIAPIHDEHGAITHFVALKEDITERRRLEAELLEVTDREQQRIGHDLHDGLGQQLTALEMKCFLLMEDLAADERAARRQKLQKQAQHISQALRECITVTRSIAHGLAPVILKTEGLQGALEQLAQRARVPGKIECRLVCRHPVALEDFQTVKQLYRIAQEAVNNALKHSKTRRIRIILAHTKGALRLQIKDDGQGLPKHRKSKSGVGLEIMRHRAHVIGAMLEVDSKPLKGVRVTCSLPMKNHEN